VQTGIFAVYLFSSGNPKFFSCQPTSSYCARKEYVDEPTSVLFSVCWFLHCIHMNSELGHDSHLLCLPRSFTNIFLLWKPIDVFPRLKLVADHVIIIAASLRSTPLRFGSKRKTRVTLALKLYHGAISDQMICSAFETDSVSDLI